MALTESGATLARKVGEQEFGLTPRAATSLLLLLGNFSERQILHMDYLRAYAIKNWRRK